jgi:hypothetical protein
MAPRPYPAPSTLNRYARVYRSRPHFLGEITSLLAQSAVDVLDETLLLFDQAISGREAAAKQKVAEALAERAKGGENRQALLDEILTIVLVNDG